MVCEVAPLTGGVLCNLLQERFRDSGHPTLSRLSVAAQSDEIVLSGQVPTFYLKQLAQTIAVQVCGPHRISNQTTVTNGSIGAGILPLPVGA